MVSDFPSVYTKIGCGAEPALSERSESNGRLLELPKGDNGAVHGP